MSFQWQKGGSSKGQPGYFLTFGYDTEIIRKLKATIPAYLREWDDNKKRWWVDERCERFINDIFPGFLEGVIAQQCLFWGGK